MENNENEVKKGFSWLGFFFPSYYYAGYGKLGKGLILLALQIIIPIVGTLGVMIYGGIKARKELPIKEVSFKWLNVLIMFIVSNALIFALMTLLSSNSLTWDEQGQTQLKSEVSQYNINDKEKECVYNTVIDNMKQQEFLSLRAYQTEQVIINSYEQFCKGK
jgi:hypothetical protein